MHTTQKREMQKALDLIKALGCRFLVLDPEGNHHGELTVAPERKRAPRKYEYGSVKTFLEPILNLDLQMGEVQVIPKSEYDSESVRRSACSTLTQTWGPGTYTTHVSKTGDVEIMRTCYLA